MNSSLFQLNKKYPLRFVWLALVFLYVLQYPLSRLMGIYQPDLEYGWAEWVLAYLFVALSTSILIPAIYLGMSGTSVAIRAEAPILKARKIGLLTVLLVFMLFFVWSYVMLRLNIGITIYADFEPLPFKLAGLLFYGRLIVQPVILAYIAYSYSSSKWRVPVLVLLICLGAWASMTSGSRFVGVMFSMPLLLILKGASRSIVFLMVLMSYIVIGSLSRSFFLPFQIGVEEIIQIYANAEYQAAALDNLFLLPISYLASRSMGIGEVLLTLNFGAIAPSLADSLQNVFAYFLPFISPGATVSVKQIYGLDDDAFGGLGLDLFSNYWVFFGGSLITYIPGIVLSGWLLGRSYRLFAIGLKRFGFEEAQLLIFALLFIFLFEGRAFLFPWLLLVAWLFSRKNAPRCVFVGIHFFFPKHFHHSAGLSAVSPKNSTRG